MEFKKILIVDDEEEILNLVYTKLLSSGFQAARAIDGKEAIQKARVFDPDLILMDIVLPDMDGPDVVKSLQKDPRLKNIPVMFLSGIVTKEQGSVAEINVGGKIYPAISKPFTFQELLREIDIMLPG